MAHAPPSEPIGTRDIDSTPPASTRSSQPEATFCAAMFTASRPEAQKRLSWTPATVSGSPALIAAVLAMSAPWSPTGDTQPSTTSSTRCGSSSVLRPSISWIRPTTGATGLVPWSEPLDLPLPRGVRSASKTSASVCAISGAPFLAVSDPGTSRVPGQGTILSSGSQRRLLARRQRASTRLLDEQRGADGAAEVAERRDAHGGRAVVREEVRLHRLG